MKWKIWIVTAFFALVMVALGLGHAAREKTLSAQARTDKTRVPVFEVDASWPKPHLNWLIGHTTSIAVDRQGHIWILQRPASLTNDELGEKWGADCCVPAPPIMEFDAAGNFIQGWGGKSVAKDWPEAHEITALGTPEAGEHGIFVDYKDNVWTAGTGENDGQVLKFTKTGKLLLEIGRKRRDGEKADSNDLTVLYRASNMTVWPQTNEVFISDGYGNRRIIVFDADTGAYKRHWGAYGKKPDDSVPRQRANSDNDPPPQQFSTVHSVRIANDGLVYVADRNNNRLQVFKIDGTFVKEQFVERKTRAIGTVADLAFSPDRQQEFIYVADGSNGHVWILDRQTLQILGKFGRRGRNAGQFHWLHTLTSDANGNIYTGEGNNAKRAQKFVFKGFGQ